MLQKINAFVVLLYKDEEILFTFPKRNQLYVEIFTAILRLDHLTVISMV